MKNTVNSLISFSTFTQLVKLFVIGIVVGVIISQHNTIVRLQFENYCLFENAKANEFMLDVYLDSEFIKRIHPRVTKNSSRFFLGRNIQ